MKLWRCYFDSKILFVLFVTDYSLLVPIVFEELAKLIVTTKVTVFWGKKTSAELLLQCILFLDWDVDSFMTLDKHRCIIIVFINILIVNISVLKWSEKSMLNAQGKIFHFQRLLVYTVTKF